MGWQARQGPRRTWDWDGNGHSVYPASRDHEAWAKDEALKSIGWEGRTDAFGDPEDGTFGWVGWEGEETKTWVLRCHAMRDGGHADGEGW